MNELIHISTDAQGASVVSARELHSFLEVKSKFADWIKNRIIKYGFLEDTDYVPLSKNLENGGKEHDYALTLDTAKQLAMVENNDRGKQARRYFIDAEKALRQLTPPAPAAPTTEQVLIQLISQQNQLMTGTQELLSQLRADVDRIIAGKRLPPSSRRDGGRQLGLPDIPSPSVPPLSLRQQINRRIDDYCELQGYDRYDTWKYLYRRMHQVYGVDVHRLNRSVGESTLDTIERYGRLNDLYNLIANELI